MTDLDSWQLPAFGEPCDSLVLEIKRLGGYRMLADDTDLSRHLTRAWRRGQPLDDDVSARLETRLVTVRDRLRAEATARGWEVD